MQGVDYSFSRPDLACLKRNGYGFVVRYIAAGQSAKEATRTEVDALIAAGLLVVLVYQDGRSDMLRGRDEGVHDAKVAKAEAAKVGQPTNRPIYFALDRDPGSLTDAQIDACRAYLNGAVSVLGRHRVGVYAGYRGIEELCPRWAPWGWQTYAWSRGQISSKAHFRQYRNGVDLCGGQVDLNETYRPDFGQWPSTEAAPPTSPPDLEEDDVKGILVQAKGDPHWWFVCGLGRRWVRSPGHANMLIFLGWAAAQENNQPFVWDRKDILQFPLLDGSPKPSGW